jgi:hypothetical protein
MVVSAAVAGVVLIAIVAWNRRLGPSQSATAPWALKAVGVVGGLLVVSALAIGAGTIVVVVNRLQISHQVTRALGVLAVAMATVLTLIFAGTLAWWISTAIHAPWFFGSLVPRSPVSPAPLAMVMLTVMMLSGLALAGFGTVTIVGIMSRTPVDPTLGEQSG